MRMQTTDSLASAANGSAAGSSQISGHGTQPLLPKMASGHGDKQPGPAAAQPGAAGETPLASSKLKEQQALTDASHGNYNEMAAVAAGRPGVGAASSSGTEAGAGDAVATGGALEPGVNQQTSVTALSGGGYDPSLHAATATTATTTQTFTITKMTWNDFQRCKFFHPPVEM